MPRRVKSYSGKSIKRNLSNIRRRRSLSARTSLDPKIVSPQALEYIRARNKFVKNPTRKTYIDYAIITRELDICDDVYGDDSLDARDLRAIEEYIKFRGGIKELRKTMLKREFSTQYGRGIHSRSKYARLYTTTGDENDWKRLIKNIKKIYNR